MSNFNRIVSYSRAYWKMLILSLIAASLYGIVAALPTYLIKHTIDDVFIKQCSHLIVPFVGTFVLFFALKGVLMYLTAWSMHWVGNRVVNDIRFDFFKKIIYFPISFYQSNSTGTLLSHFLNDIQMLQNASSAAIKNGVRSFFESIFLIGFAFLQNWKLACLMSVVGPLMAVVIKKMGDRIKRSSRSIQKEVGIMSTTLQEVFTGIRDVKAYNGEPVEINRFEDVLNRSFNAVMRYIRLENLMPALIEVIAMAGGGLAFYVAAHQVLSGSITPGQLTSFLAATLLAYQPIKRLINVYGEIQYALAAADRIFDKMDLSFSEGDKSGKLLSFFSDSIIFQQVSFEYQRAQPVLSNVSLTIRKGQRIGIIGASGSGKSTFCDLLLGFITPTKGTITLDGISLEEFETASLRQRIGYVGQRAFLFNDSIANNIAYAMSSINEEKIYAAAKAAHVHEFVQLLPQGYKTIVGENGNGLSGGQKQRITIARALLRNPDILIFDEATSALDHESEAIIKQTIQELSSDKTVIIITHRYSLLEHVDEIVLIEDKQIKSVPKDFIKPNSSGKTELLFG